MKYLVLINIFTNSAFAQLDSLSEALKYYPIQTDNYWEYKNYYWQDPFYYRSSAHSIKIIGDTILPNNKKYKILLQKNIPDDSSSFKAYERVDSLTACVYRYSTDVMSSNNEYLVDSLLAQPGDYFAASRKCIAEYEDTVLNLITDVKDLEDQTIIPVLNYTLAKGFGFVSSGSCEFGCSSSNLVYALIDGIVYGNKITNIEEGELIAPHNEYILYQNYPNPFNPNTTIIYQIPKTGLVTLKVYDILGSEVATLVNKEKSAGNYEVEFDGSNLSSGIYFYKLQAGSFVQTKKMIYLK